MFFIADPAAEEAHSAGALVVEWLDERRNGERLGVRIEPEAASGSAEAVGYAEAGELVECFRQVVARCSKGAGNVIHRYRSAILDACEVESGPQGIFCRSGDHCPALPIISICM